MTETSQIAKSPLLPIIRNLVTTMFIYADKSLVSLSEKYKLLETIRYIIITCFLFLVRVLPSLLPSLFLCLDPNQDVNNNIKIVPTNYYYYNSTNSLKGEVHAPISASGGDSGIERALTQLLSIINDIPVSSRKYDIVRSLAERLIDENHVDNIQTLRQVNRTVLSGAFSRALSQLEVVMVELGRNQLGSGSLGFGPIKYILNRVFKVVQSVKEGPLLGRLVRATATHDKVTWSGDLAEKLVAELLWLAQKMVACGDGEEVVWRWASASNVAWLALTAEPRLQCSLVKVSAFLFKQAKDMRVEDFEEGKKEVNKQTKKRMLMSWLPLLCRANNGMDSPVLCTSEKAELERVLEAIIENFSHEEDQEQVLSIWLYHFTHCPSSDWPNLHNSYARWCTASRRHLILQ